MNQFLTRKVQGYLCVYSLMHNMSQEKPCILIIIIIKTLPLKFDLHASKIHFHPQHYKTS